MRTPCLILAVSALAAGSLGACGGARPPAFAASEFTAEDAEVFEDGVDFVEDPEALQGRWREEWSRDLERRVSEADLIGIVTVHYVRTDTDLERVSTYRLVVVVHDQLLGEAPSDEVTLTVREGDPGYGTVEGNAQRILDQRFIVFIKWYQSDPSTVLPHWHLAPASRPVVSRTRDLIGRRRGVVDDSRTIEVVHES